MSCLVDPKNSSSVKKYQAKVDRVERNIILIGPSQNGKSSLANFLVRGRALKDQEPSIFCIGNGIKSCTKTLKSATTKWVYQYLPDEFANKEDIIKDRALAKQHQKLKYCTFRIIDTPGTGDSDENSEQEKMQLIYEGLLNIRNSSTQLSLLILVVKFPTLLDKDLERNIQFYLKMIPQIMTSNLFLIITNVERNKDWERRHMRGGKQNPKVIINQLQKEVQNMIGKNCVLTTETIDSLCDTGTDEEKFAIKVRARIFETCMRSASINLDLLLLPKTKLILEEHKQHITKLEGEKEGIIKGINLAQEALSETTKKISKRNQEMQEAEKKLKEKEANLEEKDSDKLQPLTNESFTDTWHFLWRGTSNFDITVEHPIKQKVIVGGYAAYEIEDEKHIKGHLYAPFWSSLDCHVILYTHYRDYFAEQIQILKVDVEHLRKELISKQDQFNDCSGEAREFEQKLKSFRDNIGQIDKEIQYFSSDYIKLPDFETSLRIKHREQNSKCFSNDAQKSADDNKDSPTLRDLSSKTNSNEDQISETFNDPTSSKVELGEDVVDIYLNEDNEESYYGYGLFNNILQYAPLLYGAGPLQTDNEPNAEQ